jgi:FkbM family methyltransferase
MTPDPDWVIPPGGKPPRADALPWALIRRFGLLDAAPPVLLDIGANIGTTAIPPLASGDIQRVYAVEPDSDSHACLLENARARGVADRLVTACCAVSDADGTGRLYRATAPTTRRLLISTRKAGVHKVATVPTRRLDTLVAEWRLEPSSIGWIKVDVQGWESRVLAGAPSLAASRGIVWVLEISPKHLATAGTPLPDLLRQCEALFSHAIDLRHGREPIQTRDLAAGLEYLGDGNRYTNLVLYHADH